MADGSWYIDEDDPTLVRWHDGTYWTDHVLVRADWDGAGEAPPPPWDPAWLPARSSPLRFAAGTAAVVLVVVVAAVALFGDGGSDKPTDGSTIGQTSQDDDRSTADGVTPLSGLGASSDLLAGDATTDGGSAGTGGDADEPVTRRSGSGTTAPRTTTPAVQRTETRTETHTNTSPRTVPGPRDETKVGNSTATTISDKYTPPPTTAAPHTTQAPATTAPPDTTPTDGGTTGGATDS